jgi:dienelactone hydrolase
LKIAAMLLLCFPASAAAARQPQTQAVTFRTADRVTVYAWYHKVTPSHATILLFHQAGSSHQEYDAIAPRLNALGYSTLAVDQRAGGAMFGPNLTRAELGYEGSYESALSDLRAAITWAHRNASHRVILWGSSYSASLAFAAAAQTRGITALLAFSPGEYFDDKQFVRRAAAQVTIPFFVDSAANQEEIRAAAEIAAASPSHHKTVYVPQYGIHGSSTLLESRDPAGARENWAAVERFLREIIR